MKKSLVIGIAVGALALLGGTFAVKYMGTHGVHSIENIAEGTNHASHKGATGTESADPHANHGAEGGEKCSMMTPEMKVKMEAKGKMKDGKCAMMEMKGMMANLTPEQKLAMEKEMIEIDEKKLELRIVNNSATPDTKKAESLTAEISALEAKHIENMYKIMPVPAKTN